ncbi:hypothetical protein [Nocardioides sp. CFH 31398]|uniref:hypothetical protein n=1 Tax=Nocardioides sp. CFH 31398 TaxID=2919579 RepID=UPI001F06C929|nr:hypothetical protein [Nocardioides sp. CFH 31398]MCH1865224.1 hypothetical protein [Nocardioides sp. CFH 31398]
MTGADPSERWRELDAHPAEPPGSVEPAGPAGPSPYETYPWAAVGGQPVVPVAPYPAYPPPWPVPVTHPSAATALTLGVIGTLGGMACGLPLLLSPAAVALARRARREIDASQGALTGRSTATAGLVLGSVGCVLLAVLALIVVVAVAG